MRRLVEQLVRAPQDAAEVLLHLSLLAEQKRQREALASVLMSAKFDPRTWTGRPCEPMACHEQWVRLGTEGLRDFMLGVTDSTFTITTASGHQIQHEDPDLVVWAIQRVISAAVRR